MPIVQAPDILGGMAKGANIRGQMLQQQAMQQQMGQRDALMPGKMQQQQLAGQQQQAEHERFMDKANMQSMAKGAYEFLQIKDPAQQDAFLNNRLQEITQRGGDPRDTLEMMDMAPEERQVAAQNVMGIWEKFGGGKAAAQAKQASPADKFKMAKDIRAEFSKDSKVFKDTRNAFGRVQAVTRNPSAAGDLALIFNFMKMLDPGSVVRESEFRTAEQARAWMSKTDEGKHPIPAFVKQSLQKLESGKKLLPEQRTDFLSQSTNIFDELKGRQQVTRQSYIDLAKRYGLEEADIIIKSGEVKRGKAKKKLKYNPTTGGFD